MKYYGFQFSNGKNTTTGQPNPDPGFFHGRLSTAGDAKLFFSRKKRDEWVSNGCNSRGGRIAVSKRELRKLCRGMTKKEFQEYLEYLEYMRKYED